MEQRAFPEYHQGQELPVNRIIQGDCIDVMKSLPNNCVDLIFADPPYNLQLRNELLRPNQTTVAGVDDEWDQFSDFEAYDRFTRAWLAECRRILKADGAIWVIGSYHNIFRVGAIMMDMGFWILNDVIWHKTNPMPNFRGTRFTNATETLIWAKKSAEQKKYSFNYRSMKNMNDEKQMQNVWYIPLCTGPERIKIDGKKAHSTQKPEALLYRVILASSNPGDIVLDPFFGSGTTGAVAKKLKRNYIGIEREPSYIEVARHRINSLPLMLFDDTVLVTKTKRSAPRVSFGQLLESGYIHVAQQVHSKTRDQSATVKADGHLVWNDSTGSIHEIAALAQGKSAFNGWEFWYVEDESGSLVSIDVLRERYRVDANAE
jgi:site-specific DNA-methyltransferase (adenine-specific)/modification methylase